MRPAFRRWAPPFCSTIARTACYQRALTDDRGAFIFAGLLPDLYSIRVSLASFVPAIRGNIVVQPGMRSVLNVSLATLFSTIQLVPLSAQQRYPDERRVEMGAAHVERHPAGAALAARRAM